MSGSAKSAATQEIAACFSPGERVRVVRAYPIGHVRTPYYIRGQSGVVERVCGAFRNPEELAYARMDTPRVPLYRVRFLQREVWPGYRGAAGDTVDVEIFQHWLEPLTQESVRAELVAAP